MPRRHAADASRGEAWDGPSTSSAQPLPRRADDERSTTRTSGPLSPHTLNGSRRRARSGMLDALASDLQLCQPHACTAFSQLALFVHYDPAKFSEGTDCRDLLQHLWNTHAKHSNRGSLYYKYLTSFQLRQQTCSVCESHAAATVVQTWNRNCGLTNRDACWYSAASTDPGTWLATSEQKDGSWSSSIRWRQLSPLRESPPGPRPLRSLDKPDGLPSEELTESERIQLKEANRLIALSARLAEIQATAGRAFWMSCG